MKNKRILITGASGNLGKRVINKLSTSQYEIVTLQSSNNPHLFIKDNSKFTNLKCDISNKREVLDSLSVFDNIDVVVHLAALVLSKETSLNKFFKVNVLGTFNLLNTLCSKKIDRFIFSSSMAVYGYPKYLPVDTKHPLNPINFYGITKKQSEELIFFYSKHFNFSSISFRLPGLFGHEIKKGAIYNFIKNSVSNKPLRVILNGTPWDILHIDDAATMIVKSINSDIFNDKNQYILNPDYGYKVDVLSIAKKIKSLSKSNSKIKLVGGKKTIFYYKKDKYLLNLMKLPKLEDRLLSMIN